MKNKNIFILPTTEPSQVYLVKSTNALGLTSNNPESMEHYGSGTHNQHVYITNKDPYERGDWVKNVTIEADPPFKFDNQGIIRITQNIPVGYEYEKIILTSDTKLITDGIAGIDIEFLRSLKDKKLDEISTVEVEKTPLLSNNGRALFGYKYTPIIPKKNIVVLAGEDAIEQAKEMYLDSPLPHSYKRAVEFGIKWQKEQDKNKFSEDDMREMYNKSCGLIGLGELNDQTENNNRFRELIEKIKNK